MLEGPRQCARSRRVPLTRGRRASAIASVALGIALAGPAAAQTTTDDNTDDSADAPPAPRAATSQADRELALQLGREGIDLYNEQRFEDAYDRFANAEALVHSPVFVLYLARIERRRGHWREALRLFDTVGLEQLPAGAPPTWARAKREAELERSRLALALPSIAVQVVHAPPSEVTVWIDGRLVKDWHNQHVFLDPGSHEVVARFEKQEVRRPIKMVANQKAIPLSLSFEAPETPSPDALPHSHGWQQPVGGVVSADQPLLRPDERKPSGQRTAGNVLLIAGGITSVATLAVGIGAIVKTVELESVCIEQECPGALADDVQQQDDLNRATLGLGIAAGTLLIAGWIVKGTAPRYASQGREPVWRWGLTPAGLGGSVTW